MRTILVALAALFTIGMAVSADAQRGRDRDRFYFDPGPPERVYGQRYYPQRYRWCAHYGPRIGASNCYFTTFAQCRAAVSGVGGFCARSPYWD